MTLNRRVQFAQAYGRAERADDTGRGCNPVADPFYYLSASTDLGEMQLFEHHARRRGDSVQMVMVTIWLHF